VPGGAPEVLGGPVWWFVVGVYLLAIALAAFVLIDSSRPRRRDRLAALPEPAWLYAGMSGLYLACVVGAWIPGVPRVLTVIPVFLTLLAMPTAVAYLLRVVYPKPAGGDAAEGQTAGDGGPGSFADHNAIEK
jgi:hypothetical protein